MTGKHQALRDALKTTEFPCGEMIRSLLADHDRMREALEGLLNALPSATTHPAIKAAREALLEATK